MLDQSLDKELCYLKSLVWSCISMILLKPLVRNQNPILQILSSIFEKYTGCFI